MYVDVSHMRDVFVWLSDPLNSGVAKIEKTRTSRGEGKSFISNTRMQLQLITWPIL